jgi:hypothetical protein
MNGAKEFSTISRPPCSTSPKQLASARWPLTLNCPWSSKAVTVTTPDVNIIKKIPILIGNSENSIRIGFPGAGNADPVVGKLGVSAGQFDLGHVAGDAFRFADLAKPGAGGRLCARMTGKAF